MTFISRVPIRQFVDDMRLAFTDDELMQKYQISVHELRSMIKALAVRGVLKKEELEVRPGDYEDTVVMDLPE
jgi:hypothetical protein